MPETLAVKYRPKTFDEVVGQDAVKAVLVNQIRTGGIRNAYLFEGPAGCGKTTSARLFAKEINGGDGSGIIEIDAASNNSVDDVRRIREDASFRSLTSKYKTYILDEAHMLSASAWAALLKLMEEPPESTVFILCTTDAQKVPQTIVSRVQSFRFTKISLNGIKNRLDEICDAEYGCFPFEEDAVDYIAKQAHGGMREAISLMGKVLDSIPDKGRLTDGCVDVGEVVRILGTADYWTMYRLARSVLLKSCEDRPESIVASVHESGRDLKTFLRDFLSFALDLCIFHDSGDVRDTDLPPTEEWERELAGFDFDVGSKGPFLNLLDTVLRVSNDVRWDPNPLPAIRAELALLREEIAK